jgi:hypothetical protein
MPGLVSVVKEHVPEEAMSVLMDAAYIIAGAFIGRFILGFARNANLPFVSEYGSELCFIGGVVGAVYIKHNLVRKVLIGLAIAGAFGMVEKYIPVLAAVSAPALNK